MNLQQLRYLVATADEGTMTSAATSLHVAQPALSRAIRAFEGEIGVTVFERRGRGVRLTRDGREVLDIARRVLSDLERMSAVARRGVLRIAAVAGQAREIGSPAIARFVTGEGRRAALEVADAAAEVVDRVRDGRAHLGIVDLPAPRDLFAVSLGWQEVVLVHPAEWVLDDPLDATRLADLPLVSLGRGDWRRSAIEDNMRAFGIEPHITAEASQRDLLPGLVQEGAGAWFSYGRQAEAAVAAGAGLVHLDPPVVREIGIVTVDEPDEVVGTFIDIARAATETTLLPAGDPVLQTAAWLKGTEVVATPPPSTTVPPAPTAG